MTKVALRIFSIKLLKITYQIAKLINGKTPRAKTEERKMANTSVIVIPEGKICDYVDGKFRNDTPEEYVRQTIEKRLVNEHKYLPKQIRIEYTLQLGSRNPVRILSFLIKIVASRLRRTLKSSSSVKKRLLKHVMLKTVLSN